MRIITVILLCFSLFGISQNTQVFEEANALYNDGKFAEAIDKYESILDSDVHSAELYFNLANANYKLNNIAPSVYYYEKALLLNPNDEEIKNNLAFAQNMTIDAIDKVPDVGFSKIIKNFVNTLSSDTWAIIAVIGVFIFVLLFLLYHFSQATSRKRLAFVVSIASLFIAILSVVMAFQKVRLDAKKNPAIVFAQESRVKSDPNKSSEEVFRLHEGTKVQVLETYEDWNKIQLADNSVGWIQSQDIKLLNDF
ncbi:tetratricopeptide repeat protein [Winogradskyella poriferorum]|uniref:tetratricopeptide repeat protein n=1 Tax=Winogradskyella poriferorum TaxID=307627 RepID=UPI003D645E0F